MPQLILLQTNSPENEALAEAARNAGLPPPMGGNADSLSFPGPTLAVIGSEALSPLTLLRRLAASSPGTAVLLLCPEHTLDNWRLLLAASPLVPARAALADASRPATWPALIAPLLEVSPAPASPLAALADQLCACAPAGFVLASASLRLVGANPQLAEILGLSERAIAGLPLDTWFGSEIKRGLEARGTSFTLKLRRTDGTDRDLEITAGPLPLADGSTGHLLAFRDISRRTRAQEELRRSERRLRHVVDLVPHMIFLKDAEGRFALVNQEAANLYGTTVENLTAKVQAEVHAHPGELAAMLASDRQVLETGARVDSPETAFTTPSGETRCLSVIKVPFQPDPGQPAVVLGLALDITDLRQAREELKTANQDLERRVVERTAELAHAALELEEERHLFAMLMDNLPERIYFKDRDSRFIRGNHAILTQFGLASQAQLKGLSDADCFTPEHAAPARADEILIMETGQAIVEKEEKETFPDGHVTWSATTKMPLRDRNGETIGTFGISRDITARKRIEDELAHERLLMSNLMDSLPDKIFFKDLDSRFIRVNKAHAAQFNLASSEEAIGRNDADYFSLENADAARSDELELIGQSKPMINREMREILANGKKRWIHVIKLPLRDKSGEIIGTFGVVRDITARKKAEDEARKASEMLRAIIDNIPDRIVVKDPDGRMLINNRAHRRFLGRELSQSAEGKLITELFNVPWAHTALANDLNIMRTGKKEVDREEHVEMSGQGDDHWMITSKVPLKRKKTDEIIGLVVISHDITKRKRIEDKLRESREKLQNTNESMNTDLEMARQVQQAFLQQRLPEFPLGSGPESRNFGFGLHYEGSSKLAGDFFNVIRLNDNRAGLLVCDVMGHGLRAALFTAMIRGLIEEMRPIADDPGAFLTEINKALSKIVLPNDETPIFVTASYVVVDAAIRRFRYANAGHPPLLLLRAASGEVTALDAGGGESEPALGFEDGQVYTAHKGTIEIGDTLLLHTDGITEALKDEEEYGETRLREAFQKHASLPPEEVADKLVGEVRAFTGKKEFADDICVLVARVLAASGRDG